MDGTVKYSHRFWMYVFLCAWIGVYPLVGVHGEVLVRLVNGTTQNEGNVEVSYLGHWGNICSRGWSIKEAHVICRQLGYPSASQAWLHAHFGEGLGPILLMNVACNGNETSIDQCVHDGWYNHYCSHYEDAGVTCHTSELSTVSVRLANSSHEGRVEVLYKCQWGTLCSYSWSLREANVICRQLGYPSASEAWSDDFKFGRGSGPILLANVACTGNESSIVDCDHLGWFNHDCRHSGDVGVTCNSGIIPVTVRLVDGANPYEGRVEVYYQDRWGTVCDNSWSLQDANVICRQLGFPSASQAWQNAHFGQGSGSILLGSVACNGDESNIDECDHSEWINHTCIHHDMDVGVTCGQSLDFTTSAPSAVSVRLVKGETPHEGRVEVLYQCNWGTICSYGWSIKEADVICRQLGYPSASNAWRFGHFGQGSGPVLLRNVACNGDEARIDQCKHDGWFNNSCGHYEDAAVTCATEAHHPVSVRLVNGNEPYEGTVEVYYQGSWGTIVDMYWSIEEARVVCRQLGYPSASQAWGNAHFGQGSGVILLDQVACVGNESRIDECDYVGATYGNRYHYRDAGVTCGLMHPLPVPVRLMSGSGPHEGRVEMFYRCQWGTVCSYDWSIREANIICRQLGYQCATHAWRGVQFGHGSGPILLGNVACRGDEASIDQCDHLGWFNQRCSYSGPVGVTCNKTSTSSVTVRLVDGANPYEGRVEVYYQDRWGTVCDNSWSLQDANVICRQLGYPSASQAWQNAHFGQGSGSILLGSVACNGDESNIDECDHSEWFNPTCSHEMDVGVTCGEGLGVSVNSTVSVRLVNGRTSREGRVEVFYQCNWGKICSNMWAIKDADVICRQLGYPSASQIWSNARFGQGSGPYLLDNVACRGNESRIDLCDHSGWFDNSCENYADVGVTCSTTTPTPVPVRLVNGRTQYEGRVEVRYEGIWGTVCGYGWNIHGANVICRQLGYPAASQAWQKAQFGQGSGPILLSRVNCTGAESNIVDCDHVGWFNHDNCYHDTDAGVSCRLTDLPAPVRLINGSTPFEGRVEVFHECQWGTVCSMNGWEIEDANVICRQLGYPSATKAWSANDGSEPHFVKGTGPIVLSNVACTGDETSIDQCNHAGWFRPEHSCDHDADAGVTCGIPTPVPVVVRLVDGVSPYEGRVEVYYQGQWGTVCDNSWTVQDANVICRQLGFPSASQAWQNAHFGQGSGSILLGSVVCGGDESSIDQCDHGEWFNPTCSHQQAVGVACGEGQTVATAAPGAVRLVNGGNPNEGTVEVFYECIWGTICDNGWSIKDADVICRQLNYPSASQAWVNAHFGEGSGPILIDNVACNGNESTIDQCDHSGWFTYNSYCSHINDVGVTCDLKSPPPVEVRLMNGDTPSEGRVEVLYQCHWGTICSYDWSIEDANVICRQLGYPFASQAWKSAHFGQGSGPTLLGDVRCNGDESSIEHCARSGWFVTNHCYHGYDVGVSCNTTVDLIQPSHVRVVSGNTPYEGRVEVYYQGQWGTVCDNSWSLQDANVICRQLGYPSASQAWQNAHFGQGSGSILLGSVACNGDESNIDECDHSEWFSPTCSHEMDVGVTCGEEGLGVLVSSTVRLNNGTTPNEGRVELYFEGHWGTICDEGWSIKDAQVICRQLGYPSASQAWGNAHFGPGSGLVLFSYTACNGDEATIQRCLNTGWFNHTCSHSNDAGVTCDLTPTAAAQVRLVNGNSSHEGRVEVFYQCQWGTVCSYDWSIQEANVVCRQLGYPSASQAWRNAHFGRGSGPTLMDSVTCDGNESSIDQCDHSGWLNFGTSCIYFGNVGVTCDLTTPQPVQVRLADGNTPNAGRVELFYGGQWGTVCGEGWSSKTANVVCRQLGYLSASQAWQSSQFGQGLGPVLLSNLACKGTEKSIDQCDHLGWFHIIDCFRSYYAYDRSDFAVSCTRGSLNITCPANQTFNTDSGQDYATVMLPAAEIPKHFANLPMVTVMIGVNGNLYSINDSVRLPLLTSPYRLQYTAMSDAYDDATCEMNIRILGRCPAETITSSDYGCLTWPETPAGMTTSSLETCAVNTMKGGLPRAVRVCSVMPPPVSFQWEVHQILDCGAARENISIGDIAEVPVSAENAAEVAKFLANTTSGLADGAEAVPIGALSNILQNIVNASSGDIEVTKSVLETVNNIIVNYQPSSEPSDEGTSTSAIVHSIETLVSLTLRQAGNISIKQDKIHVKTVSLDRAMVQSGLSFVSVQQAGQEPSQEGTLDGTDVMTYGSNDEIPVGVEVYASIRLPGNIVDLLSSGNDGNSTQFKASFVIYSDDTLFSSAMLRGSRNNDSSSFDISGSVVSLSVEDANLENLTQPLVIEYRAPDNLAGNAASRVHCVFWDFSLENGVGDWSMEGCTLQELTNGRVVCDCDHATNFAVIVEKTRLGPTFPPEAPTVDVISQPGCIVTITALAITLIMYLSIRKLRTCKAGQILIHLCVSLLFLNVVFLAGIYNATGSGAGCVIVALLLHYFVLTTTMWMAVEARDMYISTTKVHPDEDVTRYSMLKDCIISWGLPLPIVAITLAVATKNYNNTNYCFVSPGLAMYLSLLAPVVALLIHNVITYILVVWSLLRANEEPQVQQISKRLQSTVLVFVLMCFTWCFGTLAIYLASFTFRLIFCLANALQGVIFLLVFCILCEEVRHAVGSFCRCTRSSHQGNSTDVEMITTSSPVT